MNMNLLNGTWPAVVEVDNVKNLTDEDIQAIGRVLAEKTVVVIKKQSNLTEEEQVAFCERIGFVRTYKWDNEKMWKAISPNHKQVAIVTGKRNDDNLPGLHGGHDELGWHCNSPWDPTRMPIIYLYAVEHTKGSRTSYINAIAAYEALPQEWKDRIEKFHLRPMDLYDNYSTQGQTFGLVPKENTNYQPALHQQNQAGYDTLHFPWNQITGLREVEDAEFQEIKKFLEEHMTRDEFVYHHDWEDGDIVFADQWSGLHKRWAFELMHERLLHRIGLNYDNIKF